MSAALCQLTLPQSSEKKPLTVGEPIHLSCQSASELPSWTEWDLQNLSFKLNSAETDFVKIFNAEVTADGQLAVKMTLYKAGAQPLEQLTLTDGLRESALQGEPIQISSVIKPPEDGKPVQPFGPVLPITLSTPVLYYVIFFSVLILSGLLIFRRVRRLAQERQLKVKLRDYQSPLAPDTQIYRSLRLAEKAGYPLPDLEKAFKIYLLRSYQVPFFDLTETAAMAYFKRRWPQLKEVRISAGKILSEISDLKAKSAVAVNQQGQGEEKNDLSELLQKIFRFIDQTEKVLSQNIRGGEE